MTDYLTRPTITPQPDGVGVTCNHYGVQVNSEIPVIGITSTRDCLEALEDEVANGIDLGWITHKVVCRKRDHSECEYAEGPFLIGDWVKGKRGLWEWKRGGEYSATVDFEEGYVTVYQSKYTERHGLCSPCYAGCGDIQSEGQFLCFVLPPRISGAGNSTNSEEKGQ